MSLPININYYYTHVTIPVTGFSIEDLVRVDTDARDSSSIGRRLAADGLSGGEIGADGEDSPLQSKRSSMFSIFENFRILFLFFGFLIVYPKASVAHFVCINVFANFSFFILNTVRKINNVAFLFCF